jgi:hypothetical protein
MSILAAAAATASSGATSTTATASTPSAPPAATCASIQDRVDCSSGVGDPGTKIANLTEAQCQQRGCCFDASASTRSSSSSGGPQCYYGAEGVDVEVVHMINSNHFDAGYADLTAKVVNLYFDSCVRRCGGESAGP